MDFIAERRSQETGTARLLKNIRELGWEERDGYLEAGVVRDLETQPLKVGIVFSGGPAPGGHNVVWGVYQGLQELNPKSKLYGFLGGCQGLLDGNYKEVTGELVDQFRNVGGFNMLGSGRKKIESDADFRAVTKVVKDNHLDGIVFVGGDDTNTNAGHLATHFKKNDIHCSVIGIPKTIDGDLKTKLIEASFGFDTACKVYSEMIGNICFDAMSSLKYFHFIKLMGRKASHVTLECALQTKPNIAFIGEEIEAKNQSLDDIVNHIADVVMKRAEKGKSYGVCLVPEGLVEFVPEFKVLIKELNRVVAKGQNADKLPEAQKKLFKSLPEDIQDQLMQDRDSHGNVQVSKIETEKLIYRMVEKTLKERNFAGKFNPQPHFFGYEGRCSCPSGFDAAYCFNLGLVAASLVSHRKTGFMASLGKLHKPVNDWEPKGASINAMMVEEERHGEMKRVIEKAVVDLNGRPFGELEKNRGEWAKGDCYTNPGPIQYSGAAKDATTKTLALEATK